MNAQEFSAWIKGLNFALNDHPPTREQWAKIVEEAAKLAAPVPAPPPPAVAPIPSIFDEILRKQKQVGPPHWPRQPRWAGDVMVGDAPQQQYRYAQNFGDRAGCVATPH